MRALIPAALAVCLAAPAFAQAPIHFPVKVDKPGFQAVIADVGPAYVAGQPTADALRALKAEGVTTIINLRTQREMDNRKTVPYDEEALAHELGMTYVNIPLGGPDTPYTPEAEAKMAAAMKAAGDSKVLLHCTVAWRASHMWAAYLVKEKGYSLDDATRAGMAINMGGYSDGKPAPVLGLLGRTQ